MGVKQVDLTIEELLNSIERNNDKWITCEILKTFAENGLTYMIRTGWKPKGITEECYRVFCYIKKSKEALIINTKPGGSNQFNIQLRIKDRKILNHLDKYPEKIRKIFTNGFDCKAPHCSNDGCEYVFKYNGKEYRKCHMLCNNFYVNDLNEEDLKPLMEIIRNEISFEKYKK